MSPTFAGFTVQAAYGEDDLADVALRYAGEFNGIRVGAGIGYRKSTDINNADGLGNCANLQNFGTTNALGAPADVDCRRRW